MKIINDEPDGFMVSFEWVRGGMLVSDHFPDKKAGEDLIDSEEDAWNLAKMFAEKTKGRTVNLFVISSDYRPVASHDEMYIKNR